MAHSSNARYFKMILLLLGLLMLCISAFLIYTHPNDRIIPKTVLQNLNLYTNQNISFAPVQSLTLLPTDNKPTLSPTSNPSSSLPTKAPNNISLNSTSFNTSSIMVSKPSICVQNPLIFGISNYGGIEMTTNWIYSLLQNGFEGRILIITTDYKAYEYFKTLHNNTHFNESTRLYVHCWQCQNSSSWSENYQLFVCKRPLITLWIVQQMRNDTHYLSAYDSLIYMDGDMVIMKPFTDWMSDILSSRYCAYDMVVMDDTNGDRVITEAIVQHWNTSNTTIKCKTFYYCSCFYLILHVHDTPLKVASILTDWSNICISSGGLDQPALNKALSRNQGMYNTFHCDEFPNGNRVDNKDWLNHFDIHSDIYLLHANWRRKPVKRQWFMDHNLWFVNTTVPLANDSPIGNMTNRSFDNNMT